MDKMSLILMLCRKTNNDFIYHYLSILFEYIQPDLISNCLVFLNILYVHAHMSNKFIIFSPPILAKMNCG